MPVRGPGPYQLRLLSARLREAGTEGQGLRRELYKAVTAAARPLAAEVKNVDHLMEYMPDRYAAVLAADLSVTTSKSTGRNPGISIRARARVRKRKVIQRDEGVLSHPVFGMRSKTNPRMWATWVRQTKGMKAGFFTDVMERGKPLIEYQVLAAMHKTGRKITGG